MRIVVEWFGFPSIHTWSTDMFLSILDLSVSMSFPSSAMPFCCALEDSIRCFRYSVLLSLDSSFLIGLRILSSAPSIVQRS